MQHAQKDRQRVSHLSVRPKTLRLLATTFLSLYAFYALTAVCLLDKIIYPFEQTPFVSSFARQDLAAGTIPVSIMDAGPDTEVIFYIQGNIGARGYFIEDMIAHRRMGYTVISMQWPGAEGRSGPVSEAALKADALAVMDDIPRLVGSQSPAIHLHGYSMGSGIAAYLASVRSPTSVTLQASYSSLCEIMTARAYLPACHMPGVDTWDNRPYVPSISAPVLILHGLDDTLIPPRYDMKLAEALLDAGNPPQVETYRQVGHNNFGTSSAMERVQHFIRGGYASDAPATLKEIEEKFTP